MSDHDQGGATSDAGARPRDETTVGALLGEVAGILAAAGLPDPGREAREIVSALYDVPRFWPVVNGHAMVAAEVRAQARIAADRRARGAPLAYAVGRASFRALTLSVDERVLIPRPETEMLVELVLREAGPRSGGTAVDVGVGSGAIALSLATEGSFERVIGIDVSSDALAVATANVESLRGLRHTPIELRQGMLLAPMAGESARVVVSNPPYIAQHEAAELPASVRDWEPSVALFSGPEGMDATARLVREAARVLEPGGLLALEVDARRASLVVDLVARDGDYRDVAVRLDLTGRERFVLARRRETE